MTKRLPIILACLFTLAASNLAWSEQVTFKVKHEFQHANYPKVWWLLQSNAVLMLDDSARRLTITTKPNPLDIGFDAIEKVIFEMTTHMRGGGWGNLLGSLGLAPALIGSSIENKTVSDYWCYLEYRTADGIRTYMLEIPKDMSAAVVDKMKAMLGSKVTVAAFDESIKVIKADTLADNKSRQDYKRIDAKMNPAVPEPRPDKALIVIANPLIDDPVTQGPLVRLHANDRVIAVNGWGTYAFAYVDPGEYVLAAQMKDTASALRITLVAGKDYYFLEDIVKDGAILSRHTQELVMHQVSGSRYADWKPKEK